MIKKEQMININAYAYICIYTNEELSLLKEMNSKLKESIMTSHKAYKKYFKNIQENVNKLQFEFNKLHVSIDSPQLATVRDFDNIAVDTYVSAYMNMEDSGSLLYFFNMNTYYCPKCNNLKSLSGIHEQLECCGIDKVVVNVSTKMNDTAILKKVENSNKKVLEPNLNKVKIVKKAELIVEKNEFDIYKVTKIKNNKYKSNGYNIVKDGEVIGFSRLSLLKDNLFVIVDDAIIKMPYLDTIMKLDKDIINIYKMQNADLDFKTLYSNLYHVLQAWELIQEITPENILALSLIYEHGLLSQITDSFVLSNNVLDMDTNVKRMFQKNQLGYSYFTEELNVLIKVVNSLLPNDDIDDILTKINNNKLMKDICLKHSNVIDNAINKKVVFQTKEMQNEFYSLLMFNYYKDIDTLSFIFTKIIKTHRLTASVDMVRFIQTLNMCKIVNNKLKCNSLLYGHYSNAYLDESASYTHSCNMHISETIMDKVDDMSKILNLPYFYTFGILSRELQDIVYDINNEYSLLEISDKTVSKIIKMNCRKYLIPVINDSNIYYTSWFAPDVLEQLLSNHLYIFTEYHSDTMCNELICQKNGLLKITPSMDLKEALIFLTYFNHSYNSYSLAEFSKLYQSGKITTKMLKTLFINDLNIRFVEDFEKLKEECEELFPELVGRTINYDRIVMEHDYYMQRRREGTVDMTSVFNDRYVKFKSFNMNIEGCKYIVEVPREVKDLIHEGVTQNHCMDSYGKNIEAGQEMVLFVRLKRGEPLYAISLDIHGNVIQSSGESHSAVPGEVLAQLQREFANDKTKMESLEHFFNCRNK